MEIKILVSTIPRSVKNSDLSLADHGTNFGDELNFLICPFLFKGLIDGWATCESEGLTENDILILPVGSIINSSVPDKPKKIVVGSGFGYGNSVDRTNLSSYDVLFTRGPITNMILDVAPSREAIDFAYALKLMGYGQAKDRNKILIIPHHSNQCVRLIFDRDCQLYYQLGEYLIVNPLANLKSILALISEARYVISEALHGAIIADAFRIPWASVCFGGKVNEMKWHDWLISFDEKYSPIVLCPMMADRPVFHRVLNKMRLSRGMFLSELHTNIEHACLESLLQLTKDAVLDRKMCFLDETIDTLRARLRAIAR